MQPNRGHIEQHLEFLFSEADSGFIEIAYTHPNSSALTAARMFDVSDIEKAVDFVIETNEQPGSNCYVGAALRRPEGPEVGRRNKEDFLSASCFWADIDREHDPEDLKKLYSTLPPHMAVVTGHYPHRRCQLWFKSDQPITDAQALEAANHGLIQALDADPAVYNRDRVMRIGGTIAWPKKEGRVAEVTETHLVNKGVYNYERIKACYPWSTRTVNDNGTAVEVLDDGKPRNRVTGNLNVAALLDASRTPGQWHVSMRDAVAHMVGSGWSDTQIALSAGPYCDGGSNDPELLDMVSTARQKFQVFSGEPARNGTSGGSTHILPKAAVEDIPFTMAKDMDFHFEDNSFVQDYLEKEALSVVYGDSNCGKTFFATDLCFHIALGREWNGKRVEQGGVIYTALEGTIGLRKRVAAFTKHHRTTLDMPFCMIDTQIDFFNPEHNIEAFVDRIKERQDALGSIQIVVIDTLARALAGGDENSGQDMGMLVKHADLIRKETGTHVCFIHHSGKDQAKGARGSSSLRAAVDTEIQVSRNHDENISSISVVKQRDIEPAEDKHFSLEVVNIGESRYGDAITSCVCNPSEAPSQSFDIKLSPHQQLVFDAFKRCIADNGVERVPEPGMDPVWSVSHEELRERLRQFGFYEGITDEKARGRLRDARVGLRSKNKLNFNNNLVWCIT